MKKFLCKVMMLVVLLIIVGGCATVSPYGYSDNWIIRENDIPQYYSKMDLFYIGKAPAGYGDTHEVQFNWTKTHTNDIFGRGVRVFAPKLVEPTVEGVALALQYYLDNFHKKGHPFVIMGEGKSADLLYQAMKKCSGVNPGNGFVAAYLPDMEQKTAKEIADYFYWDNIKAAAKADDFGVIITWRSCINGEDFEGRKDSYGINPLTWQIDNTLAVAKDNIKAIFYMPEHKNIFWRKVEVKNFCGATLNADNGVLAIDCPPALLHTVDGKFTHNCISIFAGNIAENAMIRTQAMIYSKQWKH